MINYSNLFSQVENAFVIENSEGSVLADNEILEFSLRELTVQVWNFVLVNVISESLKDIHIH